MFTRYHIKVYSSVLTSLSYLFGFLIFLLLIRLSEFSNAKKDGTSQATKVIQLSLKLLYEDSSAVVLVGIVPHSHTLIYIFFGVKFFILY